MAAQGLIGLDAAIFIVMGQNIGTTVTAMLASIGSSKAARRTALMHLLIKILNAIVFFIMVSFLPITEWVEMLTPNDPQLSNRQRAHDLQHRRRDLLLPLHQSVGQAGRTHHPRRGQFHRGAPAAIPQ